MKKIKYFTALLLSAILLVATNCSDINERQQEYLDLGERIYAGKIDSLVVRGGHYRVEISGLMHYAQTVEACIIRWENDSTERTDSLIVSLSDRTIRDTMRVIVDNLTEGGHLFYVQTRDQAGNKSLNETCYGYAYGKQYILSSASKSIVLMRAEPAGIELIWNQSEEAAGVELEYDSNDGTTKTLALPGNVDTLFLPDWEIGGKVKNRTKLIPEANAIDSLYSEWLTQAFPAHVEYEMTKSKIKPLNLPFDATTGHGGQVSGVFDGMNDTDHQFHSGDGVDVPLHLTFDLGVSATLTRFEWWARDDYTNWNPLTMQLWGIEELSGAEIEIPSKDPYWESEARALGWTLLTENTITGNGIYSNSQTVQTQKKIRYLIVRPTRVVAGSGSGTYAIIREMNLYANAISPID
jgi:hypothetical protein